MASDKNEMIGRLLKFYKVENTKIKYKNMTDYAHFDVDSGVLELSTKYKEIKSNNVKSFLQTMIHEIFHAMDAKKYGVKGFKKRYEMEIAHWQAENPDEDADDWYKHIDSETNAEKFGQKNWSKWFSKFKKEGYID